MDLKVEVKEEPIWYEETSTSFTGADVKDEILVEEHTVNELVPCFKEEKLVENVPLQLDGDSYKAFNPTSHSLHQTEERPFRCTQCNMTFSKQINLKTHVLTHSRDGLNNFHEGSDDSPKRGIKTKHVSHSEMHSYNCAQCQKTFRRRGDLIRHLLTHSAEKTFQCYLCERRFVQRQYLVRHLLTHSADRPYHCTQCEMKFVQRQHLNRHLRFHSGERPHQCSQCEKNFVYRQHLTTHLKSHSGKRPYKCSICEKTYTQRGHLTIHLLTHSGERPHECDLCQKTFTRHWDLKAHLFTHRAV